MKKVLWILLLVIMSNIVFAQESQYIATYEQKVTAYNEAFYNWEAQRSTFRTTRSGKDDISFIAARNLNTAMLERITAHVQLVKSAVEQNNLGVRANNYLREINLKINELEEAKTEMSTDDSKTEVVKHAATLRKLWSEIKSEIIKPVSVEIVNGKGERFTDQLSILISKLKDKQGNLKTEGIDTFVLDETMKKIERNLRQITENVNIAEKRLSDSERLGLDSDHLFQEAINRLKEAGKLGKETVQMVNDIQNKKENYVGGVLQ